MSPFDMDRMLGEYHVPEPSDPPRVLDMNELYLLKNMDMKGILNMVRERQSGRDRGVQGLRQRRVRNKRRRP